MYKLSRLNQNIFKKNSAKMHVKDKNGYILTTVLYEPDKVNQICKQFEFQNVQNSVLEN